MVGVVENVCSSVSKAKGSGRDAENKMNGLLVVSSVMQNVSGLTHAMMQDSRERREQGQNN